MIYNIFYSWQSDLPNNTNRSFIEDCIKKAIRKIKFSSDMKVYVDYDRDTLGVTGSPDICETIFNKIDRTDIFIWIFLLSIKTMKEEKLLIQMC